MPLNGLVLCIGRSSDSLGRHSSCLLLSRLQQRSPLPHAPPAAAQQQRRQRCAVAAAARESVPQPQRRTRGSPAPALRPRGCASSPACHPATTWRPEQPAAPAAVLALRALGLHLLARHGCAARRRGRGAARGAPGAFVQQRHAAQPAAGRGGAVARARRRLACRSARRAAARRALHLAQRAAAGARVRLQLLRGGADQHRQPVSADGARSGGRFAHAGRRRLRRVSARQPGALAALHARLPAAGPVRCAPAASRARVCVRPTR